MLTDRRDPQRGIEPVNLGSGYLVQITPRRGPGLSEQFRGQLFPSATVSTFSRTGSYVRAFGPHPLSPLTETLAEALLRSACSKSGTRRTWACGDRVGQTFLAFAPGYDGVTSAFASSLRTISSTLLFRRASIPSLSVPRMSTVMNLSDGKPVTLRSFLKSFS